MLTYWISPQIYQKFDHFRTWGIMDWRFIEIILGTNIGSRLDQGLSHYKVVWFHSLKKCFIKESLDKSIILMFLEEFLGEIGIIFLNFYLLIIFLISKVVLETSSFFEDWFSSSIIGSVSAAFCNFETFSFSGKEFIFLNISRCLW